MRQATFYLHSIRETRPLRRCDDAAEKLIQSKKKLILIEHAGHFAFVTHREEFLAALLKHVRPLAVSARS
jgi:pimeloyl-ACP methyl ester carboxylesterase